MSAPNSVRSRWNRSLGLLFTVLLLAAGGSFVGSSVLLGSLRDSARDYERDSRQVSQLKDDEATYAGFAHRYLDGEVDPRRSAARAAVALDYERAIIEVRNPAGRSLLQQAYDSWQKSDAARKRLDPSTSPEARLTEHAAVTTADRVTMELVTQASALTQAAFRQRLDAADRANRWRVIVFAVTGLLSVGLMRSLSKKLSAEVLRPLETLDQATRHLAAGDLEHRVVLDTDDELGHLAQAFNTMADAIASSQEALVSAAHHDPLTGLNNRRAFDDSLSDALGGQDRRVRAVALLAGDLDRFKQVNDSLGHAAGDEVLRLVATRLLASVRPGDLAARIGGDEFAVLILAASGPEAAVEVAERIVSSVSAPMLVAGQQVRVGMSVGVALAAAGSSPEALLRAADAAMYEAKTRGQNQIVLADGSKATEAQPLGEANAG